MNERIRELNIQAAEYATAQCPSHSRDWYPIQNTRFAELIVRECIDIAYEYDAPKMSGPGMIIGNRIETHFEVEE